MNEALDVLAVSPHPDDVEIWCGGTLAKLVSLGYRVGVVDLSRGELGTRGTPETRAAECAAATKVLQLAHRENLEFPDGAIGRTSRSDLTRDDQLHYVVSALRRHRPELVFVPYWHERHPDHESASKLLTEAIFLAGLKKFGLGECSRPRQVLYYQIRYEFQPSFIVDTSAHEQQKLEAVRCYGSQVQAGTDAPTLLSSELTLPALEARDRQYGAMIGVSFGEPFLMTNTLALPDPLGHFRTLGSQEPLYFKDRQ